MASNTSSSSAFPQVKRTTSFGQQATTASLLIDKSKAHIRRSTPDSEALASSDDEQDLSHRLAHHQISKPIRRTSWLSDTNSARKSSYGASDAISPSQGWDLGSDSSSRNNNTAGFSPWGGSIWNDNQRNQPARLSELKTSYEKTPGGHLSEEALASPTGRRDSNSDAAIPFAIPLHPTLKAYRSQSYSVGQMEEEANNNNAVNRPIQTSHGSRTRAGSNFAALQHRPSRPSMLSGDFSADSTMLEQVREVADDDEGSNGNFEPSARLSGSQARKMEQIAMENTLRQQQQHTARAATLERSSSFSMQSSSPHRFSNANKSLYSQESVLEENDDDAHYALNDTAPQLSDSFHSSTGNVENRPLEHVKKGHWSSSLGFGGAQELPQSRRHSFADVPVRNPAHASNSDGRYLPAEGQLAGYNESYGRLPSDPSKPIQFSSGVMPHPSGYGVENMHRIPDAASFFSSNQMSRSNDAMRPPSSSSSIHQAYAGTSQSPAPQMYQSLNPVAPLLYLVTFKAARAEFYYVQEGTGLEVNAGDLVIVEADRGTDLGTVAHKNLDWVTARELKEKYAVEHYNWLMMFSRLKQPGQTSPPGTSAGRQFGSAIGGMRPNPSNAQPDSGEIKPKMIKRLAQPHEIQSLRDKEGNEAKAKRMCHQKVVEHHLAMEILDAEFQMDWKKLTFYYYADAYVNFNNLVTDLFKAYKTRIWMSAINPDSFVSPTPGGVGNMGPPLRPRDRFPEPRAGTEMGSMMYSTDMQQSFNGWPASHDMIPASMGPSAYSHFFTNQVQQPAYPNMPGMQPDYARTMHTAHGPPSPSSYQQFAGAGRNPNVANSVYDGQVSAAAYPDQLKLFRDLSLGS